MFNPGDKVRLKKTEGISKHHGEVIHQTGERVGWRCKECGKMWCDDWAEDLELIEDVND